MECLTEEEKKAKVAEIKGLLKAKRMERENKEKEENVQREKQRRFMGQGKGETLSAHYIREMRRERRFRRFVCITSSKHGRFTHEGCHHSRKISQIIRITYFNCSLN